MTSYEVISVRKRATVNIKRPDDVSRMLKRYANADREHFIVLSLNSAHDVVSVHIASIGLVNKTIVHPREVFRRAVADNASGIIAVHNHPSGKVNPSGEDIKTSEWLRAAGEVLGISLLDFVIIAKNDLFSFVQNGIFQA